MKTPADLLKMGETYEEQGDYGCAERFYLRALSIQELNCGLNRRELIPYLYNLGLIQFALEKYADAEHHLATLLRILRRDLPKEHEEVMEIQELLEEVKEEAALMAPRVVNG